MLILLNNLLDSCGKVRQQINWKFWKSQKKKIDYDKLNECFAEVLLSLMIIFNVLGINLFINPMTDEQLDVYKKWNDARINKDFDSADVFRNKLVEWKIL